MTPNNTLQGTRFSDRHGFRHRAVRALERHVEAVEKVLAAVVALRVRALLNDDAPMCSSSRILEDLART